MIGLKINRRIWLKLSSDTKYKCKLNTSRSVYFSFQLSLLFCRLFPIFLINGEIYKTIPIQSPRCFTRFYEKNSTQPHLFFWVSAKPLAKRWRCKLQARAEKRFKRPEFLARNSHTCVWLLIGRIVFLTREKHFSRLWLTHHGKIHFPR